MVLVEKDYTFTDSAGASYSLSDLFKGKDQLIIYHFMFSPESEEGCRGCSQIAECLPDVRHLRYKNTSLVCVSRGPATKLEAFKKRNGWTFPWYSSGGSDFNYDYNATTDEKVKPIELNFRTKEELEKLGKMVYQGDVPGFSVFFKKDGAIYYTYSTWNRGGERILSTLNLLDFTPLGRQDDERGPGGLKLKDEYEEAI